MEIFDLYDVSKITVYILNCISNNRHSERIASLILILIYLYLTVTYGILLINSEIQYYNALYWICLLSFIASYIENIYDLLHTLNGNGIFHPELYFTRTLSYLSFGHIIIKENNKVSNFFKHICETNKCYFKIIKYLIAIFVLIEWCFGVIVAPIIYSIYVFHGDKAQKESALILLSSFIILS
eukprot:49393_1